MANDTELLMRVTVEASQAVRQLEQANSAIKNVQSSAQASTGGFKNMQRGVQNASYQFQDFIVQVTGGQDAMRAFGQQAPQLLMSFGALGAVIGVVAALAPVAVEAFKNWNNSAMTLEESIKAVDAALEELQRSTKLAERKDLDAFVTQFKEGDTATRNWLIATTELGINIARLNTIDLRNGIGKQLDEIVSDLGFFEKRAATLKAYKDQSAIVNTGGVSLSDGADLAQNVYVDNAQVIAAATSVGAEYYSQYQKSSDTVLRTLEGTKDRAEALSRQAESLNSIVKGLYQAKDSGEKVSDAVIKYFTNAQRQNQGQMRLNAMMSQQQGALERLKSGDFTTTGDIKKGQEDYEYYLKVMRDQATAKQVLTAENERLNRTEFDVAASIYKTTDARKKIIALDEEYAQGKSRLNSLQYESVRQGYEEQDELEKSNQGRTLAVQMLEKNVTALEKYNQLLAQANQLNKDGSLSAEELRKVMAGAAEEYARQNQAISGITAAIGNAFSDAILSGKSFNDILTGLGRTIAELIIKTQVVLPLVKALNQAAGNIFGSGNGATTSGSGTTDGGAGAIAYPVLPNARGNVYDGSNVIPFARGGVVTNPKFFPMSTGRGLMGEAGPEAVMPLRRGPDGKLGVAAATSGGGTQVNVYNQNGGEVETKERSTPGGGKVIDIYIKKAVADGIASGQFDKAMGSTYGLRRQGAR
jgi:phage-related minor tail protein